MKIDEIKELIKKYEDLNKEVKRIENILKQGIYKVSITENYFLNENLFNTERFKKNTENVLNQEIEDLKAEMNTICKQLNIEEDSQ